MSEWQDIDTAPKDGRILIGRGSYDTDNSDDMLAVAMRFQGDLWLRDDAGSGFGINRGRGKEGVAGGFGSGPSVPVDTHARP